MPSVFETLKQAISTRSEEQDISSRHSITCKPMFEWESYTGEDRAMMTDEEQAASLILTNLYTRNGSHFHRTDINGEKYMAFNAAKYPKQQILLTLERAKQIIQNSFTVNNGRVEFPALSPEPEQYNINALVECIIGSKTASGLPTVSQERRGGKLINSIPMSAAKRIAPILGLNLSQTPQLP